MNNLLSASLTDSALQAGPIPDHVQPAILIWVEFGPNLSFAGSLANGTVPDGSEMRRRHVAVRSRAIFVLRAESPGRGRQVDIRITQAMGDPYRIKDSLCHGFFGKMCETAENFCSEAI